MTAPIWERGGLALALYFAAAAAGRFRAGRRQRAALQTPLADAAVLEAVFHPRLHDGDDAVLLTALREMFASVNRQADVEKFFSLPIQIAALSQTLAPAQRATLRRAILRLLALNDHALQCIGVQTAGDLGMTEAIPRMAALLEESGAGDTRFRQALKESLAALTGAVPYP